MPIPKGAVLQRALVQAVDVDQRGHVRQGVRHGRYGTDETQRLGNAGGEVRHTAAGLRGAGLRQGRSVKSGNGGG